MGKGLRVEDGVPGRELGEVGEGPDLTLEDRVEVEEDRPWKPGAGLLVPKLAGDAGSAAARARKMAWVDLDRSWAFGLARSARAWRTF